LEGSPVFGFVRDYPVNAAPQIWNITSVARNDVDMGMSNRLPGLGSIVDTNVEGGWMKSLGKQLSHLDDLRPQLPIITLRQVKQ
jgi:hypothetical protein